MKWQSDTVGHLAQTPPVGEEGRISLRAPTELVAEMARTQISGIFPRTTGSQMGFYVGQGSAGQFQNHGLKVLPASFST